MSFPVGSATIDTIKDGRDPGDFEGCLYSRPHFKINETDFLLDIKHTAGYRVKDGNRILIYPYKNADQESINLFLNGSVLGALLHQRAILPFHGSSFEYQGSGVIICGHSGTGKSAVTTAFCQNGGRFICDDITPVQINETRTTIMPIKTRTKLWDDSLQKLGIERGGLEKIRPMLNKFYLQEQEFCPNELQLTHLFILATHNKDEFAVNELTDIAKYNALRKQIYRKVYLQGMPETRKKYFKQLLQLAAKVRVTQVVRPQICDIYETMRVIETAINR
ncbi:MAG: hypothetical protein AAGU19_17835 [Prolixibacteraceae bacterium]